VINGSRLSRSSYVGVTIKARAMMSGLCNTCPPANRPRFATGAVYALPYVQRFKLPLVVTFHGYDVPLLWNTRRFHPYFWPFVRHGKRSDRGRMLGFERWPPVTLD
jgi:hypothetical protein